MYYFLLTYYYYYYYYYIKTTFINPCKRDFAKAMLLTSDYRIKAKKRTPAKIILKFSMRNLLSLFEA